MPTGKLFVLVMICWGAIISFRSKDEISTLNAQLTQIKQYVESLRTLRHEHLNWMSTLNGLLQMKEYDRVLAMVQGGVSGPATAY